MLQVHLAIDLIKWLMQQKNERSAVRNIQERIPHIQRVSLRYCTNLLFSIFSAYCFTEDTECYQVWKRYRHIEMRYTKGGLDENELARYNSTPLCGLDNTLPYSYANSLLQVWVLLFKF